MPRLGTESSSSSRRHASNPTLSNYCQLNSQVWQIRTPRSETAQHGESSGSHSADPQPQYDALDDLLSRSRPSSSRTRWNARTSTNPYGPRPLSKWFPSEQKHLEDLGMVLDLGSGDETEDETELPQLVAEGEEEDQEEEEDADIADDEDEGDAPHDHLDVGHDVAGTSLDAISSSQPPLTGAAAKKREKNRKKKAKARAKAKDRTPLSDLMPPTPPQELLSSMTRIAQLVNSFNTELHDEQNSLVQRVRNVFPSDGQPLSTAQWRTEVLQSVRRMESMLGRMEQWQTPVERDDIEALRQESMQLEVRVREVVEQKERNKLARQALEDQGKGKGKVQKEEIVGVAEAGSLPDERTDDGVLRAGASEQDSDCADSVSDSVAESSSVPSNNDTGLTKPDLDENCSPPQDVKVTDDASTSVVAPPQPVPTVTVPPAPVELVESIQVPPGSGEYQEASTSSGFVAPTIPTFGGRPLTVSTLASKNHNVPPEPPQDPIEYLEKNPWSMLELLFLLEVVSHFPPAEHGWTFITEAYNNLLITRPLQEWFSKQAAASNEEEAKMKSLLQKMGAEVRQLRTGSNPASKKNATSTSSKSKAGERGKTAPFGSAEARAEAHARAKPSAVPSSALSPTPNSSAAKGAVFVTRLPFPIDPTTTDLSKPPPAQRIAPLPRRRPPLTMPSADAAAFSRVMKSAAAGVRPPSSESRGAMLALFAATHSRFPVRTAWDCWHRWCTPWIVQDEPAPTDDVPPVVLDYVAGNLGLPCGTWITQMRGFAYRPVPGTYPHAPGVQHRVTGSYDPRPGLVSFARMTHLSAEKAWITVGLGRSRDGRVSDKVLEGRRARLPTTFVGIWPGKAPPPPKFLGNGVSRPSSTAPPSSSAPPTPAISGEVVPPAKGTNGVANTDAPVSTTASKTPAAASPAVPATASVHKPATAAPAVKGSPSNAPATSVPVASPATPTTPSAPKPQLPFLPHPTRRKPPPRKPPVVPEGTLGNTSRPGIRPWFEQAAVRLVVLDRLADLSHTEESFDRALAPAALHSRLAADEELWKANGMAAHAALLRRLEERRTREEARERAWREERAREAWLPPHLYRLARAIPPRPQLDGLGDSGTASTAMEVK